MREEYADPGHFKAAPGRFFFVHLMRTGGTSLASQIRSNFGPDEGYPDDADPDRMFAAKASFTLLARLPPERLALIRIFSVHMPFCACELVGPDVVIVTMLRDPVERVVSHLKLAKRTVPGCAARSLEAIYDVPWLFHTYFDNHQTRMFALRRDDPIEIVEEEVRRRTALCDPHDDQFPERVNDVFDVLRTAYGPPLVLDEARLAEAHANLERVHVLGFLDRYDEVLGTLEREHGLRIVRHPPLNIGHTEDVPDALLARIARDNQRDIEFYGYARQLYERRRAK